MVNQRIPMGEYRRRVDLATEAYNEALLDAAIDVFPVDTVLMLPYAAPPNFDARTVVTGHKQSYHDGAVTIWCKKLDKLGRANGKAKEIHPQVLDYCLRIEK